MPIQAAGIHQNVTGSRKAIEVYSSLMVQHPDDYQSRWLLNIAYMTLGEYPSQVPAAWLIPNLDKDDSNYSIKPFFDIAPSLRLNNRKMAGGTIVDDFNNDGYLDIVVSDMHLTGSMHFDENDKKGSFID